MEMDPTKFDELTKSLATPTSRRQAVKTLAASAFGSMLAFSGLDRVFAMTGRCRPGLTLCHGKCVNTKTDPKNCGVCGTVCVSGLCVNGLIHSPDRSEEHTSELQSHSDLVCRLLLEKKKKNI